MRADIERMEVQAEGADFADEWIDQSAGESKTFFLGETVADKVEIFEQLLAGAIGRKADGRGRSCNARAAASRRMRMQRTKRRCSSCG